MAAGVPSQPPLVSQPFKPDQLGTAGTETIWLKTPAELARVVIVKRETEPTAPLVIDQLSHSSRSCFVSLHTLGFCEFFGCFRYQIAYLCGFCKFLGGGSVFGVADIAYFGLWEFFGIAAVDLDSGRLVYGY